MATDQDDTGPGAAQSRRTRLRLFWRGGHPATACGHAGRKQRAHVWPRLETGVSRACPPGARGDGPAPVFGDVVEVVSGFEP